MALKKWTRAAIPFINLDPSFGISLQVVKSTLDKWTTVMGNPSADTATCMLYLMRAKIRPVVKLLTGHCWDCQTVGTLDGDIQMAH